MKTDEILLAREERRKIIEQFTQTRGAVTVKANVPGREKSIKESYLLVRLFAETAGVTDASRKYFGEGADGPWIIFDADSADLKEKAVIIEETHPLGRFIDIDVYPKNGRSSVPRGYMRKCFLCGKPAFVCGRQGTHSASDLVGFLVKTVREYFYRQVSSVLKDSLMTELNLENKFGLVSPLSNGSHKDLNYDIMVKTQTAIIPHLTKMFFTGLDGGISGLMDEIRKEGIVAEQAMLGASGGANAYKGFIFVAGIILAAAGCVAGTGGSYDDIFSDIRLMTKDIMNDFDGSTDTFGKKAYIEWGIGGVRSHASGGFTAVREAAERLDDRTDENLLRTLTYIVGSIDDTVLLKRSGNMEKYRYFKEKISAADTSDAEAVRLLNAECLKENISIGGSADVLAAAAMLNSIKKLLFACNFEIN